MTTTAKLAVALCLVALSAIADDVVLGSASALQWTGSGTTRIATFAAGGAYYPTDSLVAYWPGGETNDSFSSNTCTITSAALTNGQSGAANKAYYYNGSAYLTPANQGNFNFDSTNALSIVAWINPNSTSAYNVIAGDSAWNAPGWYFQIDNSGPSEIRFDLASAWTTDHIRRRQNGGTLVSNGVWRCAAFSYDGSRTATGVSIYVDGVLQPMSSDYTGTPGTTTNTLPMRIGNHGAAVQFFTGAIADVWIYRRVLAADEVLSIYNGSKP